MRSLLMFGRARRGADRRAGDRVACAGSTSHRATVVRSSARSRATLLAALLVGSLAALCLGPSWAAAAAAPAVSEESFSGVGLSEVVVSAHINPDEAVTTYHVEYGASEAYGQATPESDPIGSDGVKHAVSVHITSLTPGASYHFRFVATNSQGTAEGGDIAFNTYAAPVASGNCPNEARRAEQDVSALPECRAYEMVSPLEKNGSNVLGSGITFDTAFDGNGISYMALTGFGDSTGSGGLGAVQYVASRHEGEGWVSHAVTPPTARESYQLLAGVTYVRLFSSDLSHGVVEGYELPGAQPAGIPFTENYYLETTSTRALAAITTPLGSEIPGPFAITGGLTAASSDLGVVAVQTTANLLPETEGSSEKLYAWEHGTLKLAGILPNGSIPSSGSRAVGGGFLNFQANQGSVSTDGSRMVFFATPDGTSQRQLYMRKDGISTAWVSQSEASAPDSEPHEVRYAAMNPDGSKVLFTTTDRLLDSDPGGAGMGVYIYTDGPDPETERNLTFIARVKVGNANIEHPAIGMSEDGKRVYVFSEEAPGFSRTGTYLWDEGTWHFVAATQRPVELVKTFGEDFRGQISGDGRVLAFLGGEERLGNANIGEFDGELGGTETRYPGFYGEMYVYDERTETLVCASCAPTGASTTGEAKILPEASFDPVGGATMGFSESFMAADGRYVFFATKEPLVPDDSNGKEDVYEYDTQSHRVSLLSTGTSEDGAWFAGVDHEGENVFIVTSQPLVGGDTDTLVDLYDVRIGGGFPEPKSSIECVGDECQGTPSAAPTFNTASGFHGLGNVASRTTTKTKRKPLSDAQRLRRALRTCRHKPKRKQRACAKKARKRFAGKRVVSKQSRRAGR